MATGRQLLPKIITGLVIVGIVAGGYLLFHQFRTQRLPATEAIPDDAVFFVEWNNAPDIYDELMSGNRIWNWLNSIEATGQLSGIITALDSLPGEYDFLTGLLNKSKLLVSAHIGPDSLFSFLYLLSLDEHTQQNMVSNTLSGIFNAEKIPPVTNKQEIWRTHHPVGEYFITTKSGILLVSKELALIQASLAQLEKGTSVRQDEGFQRLQATAGKKVNANIYVRHPHLGSLLSKIVGTKLSYSPEFFSSLATLTELDLTIKSEELLINGYTYTPDSSSLYFNTLRGQSAQEIIMPMILPYNTRQMLWIGLEDREGYFSACDDFRSANPELQGQGLKQHSLTEIYKKAFTWLGNEMAIIHTTSDLRGTDHIFAVLKVSKGKDAIQGMRTITNQDYSATINDQQVRKLKAGRWVNGLFGHACDSLHGDYFIQLNEYIVFAPSTQSLNSFISAYENGTTLDINENYKEFSDNISDLSNLYLYLNIRNSLPALAESLTFPLASLITTYPQAFGNMQAGGIQFSTAGDLLYTNVYFKYNEAYKEENRSVWKVTLDAEVQGKPYLVWDHRGKDHKIIAFDRLNNMYLLDPYGNIIWKIQLAEPPISKVYQVDYYKNKKIQYLFNTENYIYLIDLKGRKVDNYPIKLNKSATSGLALFDYNDDLDYRILIPSSDKKVYNYMQMGSQVKGWTNPKSPGIIITPPQHLVANKKDYILITDQNGKVSIVDRKGKTRISIDQKFIKGQNSRFHFNKTNSKGVFITTGSDGHLVYISSKGKIQETVFDDFSPGHFFLYDDFDRNGYNDFIFIDRNRLIVYDRFKKVIFTYSFESQVNAMPEMITLPGKDKLLGVVCEGTVYLFDRHGKVRISAGLAGSTPFSVGYLNDDNKLNLVIGKDKTLFNYFID